MTLSTSYHWRLIELPRVEPLFSWFSGQNDFTDYSTTYIKYEKLIYFWHHQIIGKWSSKKTSLLIRRKNFYPRKMKCVNDQNWLNLKFRGGRSQVEPQPTSSVKILLILWNKVAVATLINFEIENFWRKMKLFIKTGTETLLRIFYSFSFLDLAVKFCSILFILWKFNRFFSDVIYGRTFWLSFKIFI